MDKIVLGSGKLYIDEFNGTIPTDEALEVEAKLLGLIQGGASLSYKPSFYEAKDDLGLKSEKIITDEEVTLSSGIMTWSVETLNKLAATGRVTTAAGKKTIKIGGAGNYNGKKYVLRFVHNDPVEGFLKVTIVGSNESGLELAFAKDKETVINAQFKAQPLDGEGTLLVVDEEIKATK